MLKSAMSNMQVDVLIKLIHTLIKNKDEVFVVQNHKELEKFWTGASDELALDHRYIEHLLYAKQYL